MKQLILVRHGNTFRPDETPLRVGCRTDLPLVEEGRGLRAGEILRENGFLPDRVFAAPLERTRETARLVLRAMNLTRTIEPAPAFTEIDYGDDEGRCEDDVMLRLGRHYSALEGTLAAATEEEILRRGKQAIDLWNARAVPPFGWNVDPDQIVRNWKDFADEIREGETVLVVSSNGILRFAPCLLPAEEYERFVAGNDLKVTTGGHCVFRCENGRWSVLRWNVKPK